MNSLALRVNGDHRSVPAGSSVADLVAAVLPAAVDDAGRPRGVAVAAGAGRIPRRDDALASSDPLGRIDLELAP